MEDQKLVAAARKGNLKSFEALVDRYHNQLYYTALGILKSGWDARDVCLDTFLKAFSSLDTLKDLSKFKAWIMKILINKSNDYLRKAKRTVVVEEVYDGYHIDELSEENLDMLNVLHSLKEDIRAVIVLRYFQDLPIKEIALITGCPEGTVKSRLSNGLKEMRRLMNSDGTLPDS